MKAKLLIAHLCFVCAICFAGNNTPATLYEQVASVNSQWLKIATPAYLNGPSQKFESDTKLIQEHLKQVERYLREKDISHLSPELSSRRLHSLDVLHGYWMQGKFPQNYDYSYRIPYFIDVHGTACAVGYLIIESGRKDIADMIVRKGNNDYLLDMDYPELAQWVEQSGFTAKELALIQPGYEPAVPWKTFGSGTDGVVNTSLVDDAGRLYIGGVFSEVDGVPAKNVASWSPTDGWSALGNGVEGTVMTMKAFNGRIYIGGNFTDSSGNNVACLMDWDGNSWNVSGDFLAPYGIVYALEPFNGTLAIGGEFQLPTGALRANFCTLDSTGLITGGLEFPDGPIYAMKTYNGRLMVGGMFDTVTSRFGTSNIAAFDGTTWDSVGNGTHGVVRALEVYNGKLYKGGDYNSLDFNPYWGYATWNDTMWEDLSATIGDGNFSIKTLYASPNALYIGGDVCAYPMLGYYGCGILDERIQAAGNIYGTVHTISILDGELMIGGEFDTLWTVDTAGTHYLLSQAGGLAYAGELDTIHTSTADILEVHANLFPNPISSQAILYVPEYGKLVKPSFVLTDLSGKAVHLLPIEAERTTIQLSALNSGLYLYQLMDKGKVVHRGKVVIAN
ncbi:MAG: T9SS type A sorting domain-containing protein [Chitinophagales bacterium]|nr:T9SS type A sorting domain-containing protein [Chitinophagales bacterium]